MDSGKGAIGGSEAETKRRPSQGDLLPVPRFRRPPRLARKRSRERVNGCGCRHGSKSPLTFESDLLLMGSVLELPFIPQVMLTFESYLLLVDFVYKLPVPLVSSQYVHPHRRQRGRR